MIVRGAAIAAVLVATSGCGGEADPPASAKATAGPPKLSDGGKVGTPNTSTASNSAGSSDGARVTGKIAPGLAPPSAVVVLDPKGEAELPVRSEHAIIDQAGYEFLPAFLLAQAGQPVQFRNSEDVLHNVRVTEISSQNPVFNVATVAFGTYEHKFEPGYYNVTCDIHTAMRASILVTASPYTATTAEDGSFGIANVRPGRYDLTIYAGAAPVVRPIEVKSAQTDLGTIQ